MREEAEELSVRFFFKHEVVSLTPVAATRNSAQSFVLGVRLLATPGCSLATPGYPLANVSVAKLLLNVPQRPLLRLLQTVRVAEMVWCGCVRV